MAVLKRSETWMNWLREIDSPADPGVIADGSAMQTTLHWDEESVPSTPKNEKRTVQIRREGEDVIY